MSYKTEWYLKNRDKAIAYTTRWQKDNKEKVNESHRNYYQKNKERVKVYAINYKKKHPEETKRYKRKWNKTVVAKRVVFKANLKKAMGNKCNECGYEQEPAILHFHHLRDKSFSIGHYTKYRLEAITEEAKKCILLCPNCHALHHLRLRKKI